MGRNKIVKMQNAKKDSRTNSDARDRFSELPDAIVHRILSLIPTIEAVRMSVLSKRWQNIWYSLPVLEFSAPDNDSDTESDDTIENKKEKHRRFVSNCLELRKMDMISFTDMAITKFKLSTIPSQKHIDCWLRLIAHSHIKELDLDVLRHTGYELPAHVLRIRSLTHITLSKVCLKDSIRPISLPCLMSLSLKYVVLEDETLHDLLSGCSALEKLLLDRCTKLLNPRVSSSSLKFLDIFTFSGQTFRVESTNLESLKFVGFGGFIRPNLNHSLCGSGTIKNLSFSSVPLDAKWLEDLISRLPCLESLTLVYCNLKHVKIFNEHLRHFTFRGKMWVKSEITIDAPNLVHFSYEGDLASDISVNVPNLRAALGFFDLDYDWSWYVNLIYFLSNLDCCETMCLHVRSEEALILPYILRKVLKVPLPVLKHLTVRTRRPLSRTGNLKDSLFWIMPSLETMSMAVEK